MSNHQVATRYARALFQLAEEQGQTEAVFHEVEALGRLLRASPDLAAFAANTALSGDQQRRVLEGLCADRVSALLARFLHFLAARRRLPALAAILAAFEGQYRESRRLLRAELIGAGEWRPDQVQALCRKLEAKYRMNIEAAVSTDPSLLGGFVVRVRDVVHDYSVRRQLDRLRTAIMHA